MIIVKLMGGIGNQLFQYATGRALAIKHNTSLKFDLTLLNQDPKDKYTKRNFELNLFHTSCEIANDADIERFTKLSLYRKVLRKISPALNSKYFYAYQNGFEFDARFTEFPKNTYLDGYWQSEKFFIDIRKELVQELTINKPFTDKVKIAQQLIANSNSVSLHIRRGDYVSDKGASEFHGILPLSYYYESIKYLNEKHNDLKVFIFSDDMDWVKEHLKIQNQCVYIDFNKKDDSVFDIYLMSLCNHNIIANSSFSWWGAWLNQHTDKIVIAPNQWFANKSLNTKDLIPSSWIKM